VFNIAATFTVDISRLTVADGRVQVAGPRGGGILNAGTLIVTASTLSGNSAANLGGGSGGGIYNSGTLTVIGSTLSGNSSLSSLSPAGQGAGIYNSGTLTVTGSTFSGNTLAGRDSYGAGIFNAAGTVTITNSTFSDNRASTMSAGGGGAIDNSGGTLTLTNCTLSGNSVNGHGPGSGGGIYISAGTVNVISSTLSGNSVNTPGVGGGGGIESSGTVNVISSTVSGNSASATGGGISNGGTVTLSNSTVSGNSASATGGGIWNVGTVTLSNSTVSGNSLNSPGVGSGGGIYNSSSSTVQTRNTIIAGNTGSTGPDLFGDLGSLGHNLIGDGTGGSGFDPTDLVGTASNPIDPQLGPLQNNGGPTQTMSLLPGSPAIDAGDNTGAPDTDQRGFPRIVGGTIDIGAFEIQPAGQPTHLSIQGPASVPAGTPFGITVAALDDSGQPAAGYTGMVHFTLTGPVTRMADYTFTAGDKGQHTFGNLMLRRAGIYLYGGRRRYGQSVDHRQHRIHHHAPGGQPHRLQRAQHHHGGGALRHHGDRARRIRQYGDRLRGNGDRRWPRPITPSRRLTWAATRSTTWC
jgi:hypothetical protein